jgi:integrase
MATFRRRESGRWQAIIRRDGYSQSATFGSKSAATAWARRMEREIEDNVATGRRENRTLGDLLDAVELAARRPYGRSKSAALAALARAIGHLPAALTRDDVVAYARERQAGPVTVGIDLAYLAGALATARDLLGWAVDDAPVREARAALVRAGMVGKSRERTRRPSGPELAALEAYWRDHPPRVLPMLDLMRFAISSGMRAGEVLRLRWADLDPSRRLVLIRDRKDPRRKEGNDQLVPLLDVTGYDALALILAQPRRDDRIWPYSGASLASLFPRACHACGIVDLHWHDLRREAATRMLEAGMRIEQVALVTGHREWRTLQRYSALRPEDVAAAWGSSLAPRAIGRRSS